VRTIIPLFGPEEARRMEKKKSINLETHHIVCRHKFSLKYPMIKVVIVKAFHIEHLYCFEL
jgi:hypothetical protein